MAISAISYPASMVPFPAATAAVSMSWGLPVAWASAAKAATSSYKSAPHNSVRMESMGWL